MSVTRAPSALSDIVAVLNFLVSQKTLPVAAQESLERLRNRAKAELPIDVHTVVTGELRREDE